MELETVTNSQPNMVQNAVATNFCFPFSQCHEKHQVYRATCSPLLCVRIWVQSKSRNAFSCCAPFILNSDFMCHLASQRSPLIFSFAFIVRAGSRHQFGHNRKKTKLIGFSGFGFWGGQKSCPCLLIVSFCRQPNQLDLNRQFIRKLKRKKNLFSIFIGALRKNIVSCLNLISKYFDY